MIPVYLQKILTRRTGERGRRHIHEDNVKCLLFAELLRQGFEVIAEVKIDNSRCDLVVFDGETPVCVIEVKSDKRKTINPECRQNRRYRQLGLPVFYCMGFADMERVLSLVRFSFDEFQFDRSSYTITDVL